MFRLGSIDANEANRFDGVDDAGADGVTVDHLNYLGVSNPLDAAAGLCRAARRYEYNGNTMPTSLRHSHAVCEHTPSETSNYG